ncbi:TetR/AcrR family transcriptional regulator [Falsirhodobacter algicola]|uniref:TetR family transcriptional regulator n=1 Tax=Falsirhodobacter algicola TaxID=2692330 RepID=A0A8J8SLE5_9RHOB|nr:TetR/AcrR family transcriptional regulator [Falsirhodobacter algicola]QUS36402.1 TetR family transcriptional regulator [Falsirhodobacter algicola]
MGRKRTIDRNVTMEAIETVVREQGVAGLSIEAVARAAGISKSSVVYDFASKDALLAAFVRQRLERKRAELDDAAKAHAGRPNAYLHGILDRCTQTPSDEDISCAMAITASLSGNSACREMMGERFAEDLGRVLSEADDPGRARLAWVALHGIMSLEYLGFHTFPPDERGQLLADISAFLSAPTTKT